MVTSYVYQSIVPESVRYYFLLPFFEMKCCGSCEKHNKIKRWCFWIFLLGSILINTLPMAKDKSSKTNEEDLYLWINQDISGEVKLSYLNCLTVWHGDQKHGLGTWAWLLCCCYCFLSSKKII